MSSKSGVHLSLPIHLRWNWSHFQVLNSHMWLVAIILDGIVLDSFLLLPHIFVLYLINLKSVKNVFFLFIRNLKTIKVKNLLLSDL